RLFRHLGAFDPHGDADVCFFQRRRVVDAVAGHGDDLPVGLDRLHEPELVLGARAGEDVDLPHAVLQRRIVHRLDLGSRDRRFAVADAEHFGDGGRGDLVVAGDRGHTNTATVTFPHRVDRLLAGRVHEADEAEQDQVFRQVFRLEPIRREAWLRQPGETEHALALRGEPVAFPSEAIAIERSRTVRRLLAVAMVDDYFRRALDEQNFAARRTV